MQKNLFRISLFLVVLLFIANSLAMKFYWYISVPWSDMVMHTTGGVFLAIVTCAYFYNRLKSSSTSTFWLVVVSSVFVLGLLWEGFEYLVQSVFKFNYMANIPDSISDMLFDLLGGILGGIFVLNEKKKYNAEHAS